MHKGENHINDSSESWNIDEDAFVDELDYDVFRVTPWASKRRLQYCGLYRENMENERTPLPIFNKRAILVKRCISPK